MQRPEIRLRGEHGNIVLLGYNPPVPVRIKLVLHVDRYRRWRWNQRLWERLNWLCSKWSSRSSRWQGRPCR